MPLVLGTRCMPPTTFVTVSSGAYLLDGMHSAYSVGPLLYTLKNVPQGHPVLVVSDSCNATMSGTSSVSGLSPLYQGLAHYYGDVHVNFAGCPAGTVWSLHCGNHGWMQGQHRLLQSSACADSSASSTGNKISLGLSIGLPLFVMGALGGVYLRRRKGKAAEVVSEVELAATSPESQPPSPTSVAGLLQDDTSILLELRF